MTIATDRDLLVLEPNLFRDVKFSGQVLVSASDGSVSGTTLSSISSDFVAQQIAVGEIVLVEQVPVEIIDVLSLHALTVSRLRGDINGNPIPPGPGFSLNIEIVSFLPQISIVHQLLLQAFGIDQQANLGEPQESNIINTSEAVLVEALGSLHLIYSGASALVGEQGLLWNKAQMYRDRFREAREQLVLRFDLDGDGLADASRSSNVIRLLRD